MMQFRKWLAVAVLLLWLPVTNHCRLEQLPVFSVLACCDHGETAPHQDNDCETDGCAIFEEGFYKTERELVKVTQPATRLPGSLLPEPFDVERFGFNGRLCSPSVPDELSSNWQFSCRTAASPRAPTFAS